MSQPAADGAIGGSFLFFPLRDPAAIALALVLALASVVICVYFDPHFFVIDDAQNEYVPKFYDIGRQLRSGIFPIWTDGNWLGGNYLAEYQYGLFNPLCLALSVVISFCESLQAAGLVLASVYVPLAAVGSYGLARQLGVAPALSVLVAFFSASNPVLLYFYAASWQPGLTGYAWFTLAAAALLALSRHATSPRFILAVAAAYMLLTVGWPQAVFAYGIFAALLLSFRLSDGGARRAWPIVLAGAAALLLAAPAYLELIVASHLSDRPTGIGNALGVLSWNIRPALLFFYPAFYDFMPWFSGANQQPPVPLGYAAVVALPLLCFVRADFRRLWANRHWGLAAAAGLTYLMLTQGPSQLGPMRWPFRLIPYFHLFLLVAIFLMAQHGQLVFTSTRWRVFVRLVGLALVLSLLVVARPVHPWVIWQVFSIACLAFAAYALSLCGVARRRTLGYTLLLASGVMAHVLIHARQPSLAPGFLPATTLPDVWHRLQVPEDLYEGYVLALAGQLSASKQTIADIHSSHGLLFGLKTINGYSATGHKEFSELFANQSPHGVFGGEKTLQNVLEIDPLTGKTIATLAGIRHILIPRQMFNVRTADRIEAARLDPVPLPQNKMALVNRAWRAHEGTLTHVSDGQAAVRLLDGSTPRAERFEVEAKGEPLELIFARLYWPGYRVALNGEPLAVGAYRGVFVRVQVPARARGVLTLEFVPASWPGAFAVAAAGLLCLLLGVLRLRNTQ